MSNSLDKSNVVESVPRPGKPDRFVAHSQAVEQLAAIAETIVRLEAAVEVGSDSDPLLVAARRAVAQMKEDALRIATSLQQTAPRSRGAPATSFQKENTDAARDVRR